jgi:hypothetical protein
MHDHTLINEGGGAQISFVFWRVKPVGFGEVDHGQYHAPRACISCGGASRQSHHNPRVGARHSKYKEARIKILCGVNI